MVIMMLEIEWGFGIETGIRMRISMRFWMEIGMEICMLICLKRELVSIMGLWIRVFDKDWHVDLDRDKNK